MQAREIPVWFLELLKAGERLEMDFGVLILDALFLCSKSKIFLRVRLRGVFSARPSIWRLTDLESLTRGFRTRGIESRARF